MAISERSVATDAIRFGHPIEIHTAAQYVAAYANDSVLKGGVESIVGWPLTAGGAPFGVLVLEWKQIQQLNTAQLAFISAVATMVSQALVRARIYADEHARAAVLHSVAQPVARVDAAGLDYCAWYQSPPTPHTASVGTGTAC